MDWARYLADRLIVIPAADLLPRGWALAVADLVGYIEALVPAGTTATARKEMIAATGMRGWRAYQNAAMRLAAPRRDLVILRRVRREREHPREWTVRLINAERTWEMIAAGRPFVWSEAHFAHAPDLATVLFPELAGGPSLFAPVPPLRLSAGALRERLQNQTMYGLWDKLRGLPENRIVFTGTKGVVTTLVEEARRRGGKPNLLFDAYWETPAAYRRPFAGLAQRGFALGTARIARLAQCPVVFSFAAWEPDGSVRLEWGPWIEPPAIDDDAADLAVIDRLAEAVEGVIARYPAQYLHPIGHERVWDAAMGQWRVEITATPALAVESAGDATG